MLRYTSARAVFDKLTVRFWLPVVALICPKQLQSLPVVVLPVGLDYRTHYLKYMQQLAEGKVSMVVLRCVLYIVNWILWLASLVLIDSVSHSSGLGGQMSFWGYKYLWSELDCKEQFNL